jgi:hypothetical protein
VHRQPNFWLAIILTTTAIPAAAQVGTADRFRFYGRGVIDPSVWLGAAAGAGVGQWRDAPHEWGQGAAGFGARFGSRFAQNVVKQTIQFGASAARHEDLRYHPSELHGVGARIKYAVKRSFIVPRSDGKGDTFAVSRVASNFAGGAISRSWQARSSSSMGLGIASGGIALAGDVGFNIVREFWPWRRP